jgi:hypothetical protein
MQAQRPVPCGSVQRSSWDVSVAALTPCPDQSFTGLALVQGRARRAATYCTTMHSTQQTQDMPVHIPCKSYMQEHTQITPAEDKHRNTVVTCPPTQHCNCKKSRPPTHPPRAPTDTTSWPQSSKSCPQTVPRAGGTTAHNRPANRLSVETGERLKAAQTVHAHRALDRQHTQWPD